MFLFTWKSFVMVDTLSASPSITNNSMHFFPSILLCKCVVIRSSKLCFIPDTTWSNSSLWTTKSIAWMFPANSDFCFYSETKVLIPALIASDLPEKPIVFCSLSNSDKISWFNEIETIGIRVIVINYLISLAIKVINIL